jgi:hypothetical protein
MGKQTRTSWAGAEPPPPETPPAEPVPKCAKCGQSKNKDDDPLCAICRRAVNEAAPIVEPLDPKASTTLTMDGKGNKRTRRPVGMSSLTARIRRMLMRLPTKQRRLAIQVIDAEFDELGEVIDLFGALTKETP